LLLIVASSGIWAQQAQNAAPSQPSPSDSLAAAVQELQAQVKELRAAVNDLRSESAQYRAETAELRRQLETERAQNQPPAAETEAAAPTEKPSSLEARISALEESSQLLSGKVDDQYQTKVESASKYKARLSGIVLLNVFSNRGDSDNQDIPSWADPPNALSPSGNFGATLRQSEIGLEVFGPTLAGAKTSGNVQMDFAGGFPNTSNGVNFGVARLRTASVRLDWEHTSVVGGQDSLFISPLSPTSLASLAIPSFAYAGNLWGWIPQVRVEHRFDLSADQNISVQGGILDNVVGEPPYNTYDRIPQAGERSSQPAYGTRVAWTRNIFGMPMTLGAAGYYSRQDWGFNRHVDGWAGMTDWSIPLPGRFVVSGEFYRGRGVGGLGGGIGKTVLFNGDPTLPTTQLQAVNSVGGWTQIKFKAAPKLEFNGAIGVDNPYANDVRYFNSAQNYFGSLVQNRGLLVNFIYRPKSNLLFSSEFRRYETYAVESRSWTTDQVNMSMGILF
jgi:hypothetical protein